MVRSKQLSRSKHLSAGIYLQAIQTWAIKTYIQYNKIGAYSLIRKSNLYLRRRNAVKTVVYTTVCLKTCALSMNLNI